MRYTKEQRKEILERFKKSDLKVRQFCAKEKIVPATLYRWAKLANFKEVEPKTKECTEKDTNKANLESDINFLKERIIFLEVQCSKLETKTNHLDCIGSIIQKNTDYCNSNYDFLNQKNCITQKHIEIIYEELKIKIDSLYKFGAIGFTLVAAFNTIIFFLSR